MEEQKNKENGMQEATEAAEVMQETEVVDASETVETENHVPEVPTKSLVIRILGGGYLVYTGYRMCKNVLDGVEGGNWIIFAVGIAFAVAGAAFFLNGLISYNKREKARREAEQVETERSSARQQSTDSAESVPRKMSIAERAKLVGNMEDAEPDEEETEEPAEQPSEENAE